MESIEEQAARIAAALPEAGSKREEYEVGRAKPPKEHQFKPGNQVGKGKGRPKGSVSLKAHLKELLAEVPPGEDSKTRAQMLAEKTWQDAVKKDGQSRKLCWEYIDGKAKESVEVTGNLTITDLIAAATKPDSE